MKSILLTGASGFLGSEYKKYYEENGFNVVTIGRRNTDDIFWDGSGDRKLNTKLDYKIDKIIHCLSVNEVYIKNDVVTTFDVNVTFTKVLCNFAKELKIKEFIYISTFHVYGRESGKFGPQNICSPKNDYGLTHYLSEEIIRCSFKNTRIKSLILRPTNIYGMPNELQSFNRWSLVPFDFVRSAIENGSIKLNTSGSQLRNFVHVSNVLENCPTESGFEIRDIYGAETLSILEFANLVSLIVSKNFDVKVDVLLTKKPEHTRLKKDFEFTNHYIESKKSITLEKFIEVFSKKLYFK